MDALFGCKIAAGKSIRSPPLGAILSGVEKTVELCGTISIKKWQNCTGSMMNPYTGEIFGILKSHNSYESSQKSANG